MDFHFHNATPFQDVTVFRLIAGCSAVLGHVFTDFCGFSWWQRISTAAGMMIGVAPVEVAVAIGIFLLVVFFSGYVSLGLDHRGDHAPDDDVPP